MSLIELIFGQKIIPLTIGLALLLILAALALALVPRIRQQRARHMARRQAEWQRLAVEESVYDEAEQIRPDPAPTTPRPARADASVPSNPAAVLNVKTTTAPQPAPPQQSSESTPSAMQDILASVFSDDEYSERQAALMRGMTEVDIAHLLTLSQQVAAQLHGVETVTVVGEKELD